MTRQQMLDWVSKATLYDLLYKTRFAPAGDPFFVDAVVSVALHSKLNALRTADPAAYTRASKDMGW